MGAVERHYLKRTAVFAPDKNEDGRGYHKLRDEPVRLPTLATRYASPSYIQSMQKNKFQAVIKIVSRTSGMACVNRLGDYISRDISVEDSKIMKKEGHAIENNEYLHLEDENGRMYTTKTERRALIREWSQDFKGYAAYQQQEWKEERLKQMIEERNGLQAKIVAGHASQRDLTRCSELEAAIESKSYRGKEGKVYDLTVHLPKDTTHMILSVGGKPETDKELRKATASVRQFLSKNLGEIGHRYLFTAHNDTNNLHFHVIVKNCNELTRKALRFDKADLFLMRQSFAKELEITGFERGAELRKDREMVLEKIAKGMELLHQSQTWYQKQLDKGKDASFDAFSYRARIIKKTNFLLGALSIEDRKHTHIFQIQKLSTMARIRQELKTFRKTITTIEPKELEAAKAALKSHLQKDSQFISKKIDAIKGYSYKGMQEAIQRKREKNIISASLYLKAHSKQLEKAAEHVKEKSYQDFFKRLSKTANINSKLVKELSKSLSKGIERDFGD